MKVYCTYFLLRSKINSLSGINFSEIFHNYYSFTFIYPSLLFICLLSFFNIADTLKVAATEDLQIKLVNIFWQPGKQLNVNLWWLTWYRWNVPKKFPRVSYSDYGYMFLGFYPIYGHCYGFHLISGAEGRKDPFSSLYKYLPEAPQDIFYDFACQYSEYCLNREPNYFRCTRCWHDLFHGIPHKCGKAFKSLRVSSLTGINSEICEQFNSYLQCIKYTGSHLSQPHFMFFVQFFIYLWNRDKTIKFQKIVHIALAGAM